MSEKKIYKRVVLPAGQELTHCTRCGKQLAEEGANHKVILHCQSCNFFFRVRRTSV